ncbi:hypothetical protein [Halapricum desulfuricans]|uniref:Zn finger protein n=1 Tax=Halapricum desulfuricans TaxID=2841257 RepID=A0A897MZ98_9EURY|nr:hypothetical protein [Halapricum desulfuricans]QSG05774.1 Zn finger protein [Halapricum desulfuricans]
MSITQKQYCPSCEEQRTFIQVATTTLNVGEKTKWRCQECGYRAVRIGSAVDTATA